MDSAFNVFLCGFATFAASVGYACGKKMANNHPIPSWQPGASQPVDRNASSDSLQSTSSGLSTTTTESYFLQTPIRVLPSPPRSLKRSRSAAFSDTEDDAEEIHKLGYPFNLVALYPAKKRQCLRADQPAPIVAHDGPLDDGPKHSESESEPVIKSPPIEAETVVSTEEAPKAPQPDPRTTSEIPSQDPPKISKDKPASSTGFSSFANVKRPTWKSTSAQSNCWTVSSSSEKLDHFTSPEDREEGEELKGVTGFHAIAQANGVNPDEERSEAISGEESEDVEAEVRNLKLFVKRGSQGAFSESIPGRLKLLKDKDTCERRILFRREPLLQPCMNVSLAAGTAEGLEGSSVARSNPVRVNWDDNEGVLRVSTIESNVVVVYALKGGKTSGSRIALRDLAQSKLDLYR